MLKFIFFFAACGVGVSLVAAPAQPEGGRWLAVWLRCAEPPCREEPSGLFPLGWITGGSATTAGVPTPSRP